MAVNFGLLNAPDIGAQFSAGMQDAENALARRQERDIRAQQVAGLAEQRRAAAAKSQAELQALEVEATERRQRQERLSMLLQQNGFKPSRELYATMAQDPSPQVQAIAFQALKDLDAQEQEAAELKRLGFGGAAMAQAPAAPAAPAAPTNALAGFPAPTAPANALATGGITRETIQQMLMSPNANVRARGKALLDTLPKERPSQLLTPEEEAQKTRIALASRPPRAPSGGGGGGGPRPADPLGEVGKGIVTVRDESGNITTVSRADAVRRGLVPISDDPQLTPKEIQKREATFPKAKLALKTSEVTLNTLASDLDTLANHPGLSGITGVVFGRTPSLLPESRAAQVLYDKIVARGGFSELQAMRDASPTGGALGNISNQEGQQLKNAFAEIGREQTADDMKKALLRTAAAIRASKERIKEAFEDTYSYRQAGAAQAPAAPAAPRPGAPAAPARPAGPRDLGGGFTQLD